MDTDTQSAISQTKERYLTYVAGVNQLTTEQKSKISTPKVIGKQVIGQTPWVELSEDIYIDYLGVERKWSTTSRTTRIPGCAADAVSMFCLIHRSQWPESRVLFVSQFRPSLRKNSIEFPAGLIDKGETFEEAALRELREETGYHGTNIVQISEPLSAEPGLTDSNIVIVSVFIDGDAPENQKPTPTPEAQEIGMKIYEVPFSSIVTWFHEKAKTCIIEGKIWSFFNSSAVISKISHLIHKKITHSLQPSQNLIQAAHPPKEKIKLIIDTDAGIDDIIAIMLALDQSHGTFQNFEICAITCVNGNTSLSNVLKNVSTLLYGWFGPGNPQAPKIFAGAHHPIMVPPLDASSFHGFDGLADVPDRNDSCSYEYPPEKENAVSAILDIVNNNPPNTVNFITLGPLTNLALALRIGGSEFASRLGSVFVMGGSETQNGNVSPAAEFNFYADPEAASILFSAPLKTPVKLFSWIGTMDYALPFEKLDTLIKSPENSGTTYFISKIISKLAAWGREQHYESGFWLPDPIAMLVCLHTLRNEPFVTKWGHFRTTVLTSNHGGLSRGVMVVDIRPKAQSNLDAVHTLLKEPSPHAFETPQHNINDPHPIDLDPDTITPFTDVYLIPPHVNVHVAQKVQESIIYQSLHSLCNLNLSTFSFFDIFTKP